MWVWWCLESITGHDGLNTCCQRIWMIETQKSHVSLLRLALSLWARLSPVVKWKVINNSASAHLPSLPLNLFCFHITANWLSQNGRWCMRERGREHLLANVYHLCFLPDHIRHASVMLKTTWRGRRERTNVDYCYSMQIWQWDTERDQCEVWTCSARALRHNSYFIYFI